MSSQTLSSFRDFPRFHVSDAILGKRRRSPLVVLIERDCGSQVGGSGRPDLLPVTKGPVLRPVLPVEPIGPTTLQVYIFVTSNKTKPHNKVHVSCIPREQLNSLSFLLSLPFHLPLSLHLHLAESPPP